VILTSLQAASANCASTAHAPGAAGGMVGAAGSWIDLVTFSERLHQCCAHHESGDGEQDCSVHCLPVAAPIPAEQSNGSTTARTFAPSATATLTLSALFRPDFRPPISP
jgi:hypothetical protein